MIDREVHTSLTGVVAVAFWLAAFIVWGAAWAVQSWALSNLAILLAAAGATATVRCYFVAQARCIRTAMQVTNTVPLPTRPPVPNGKPLHPH